MEKQEFKIKINAPRDTRMGYALGRRDLPGMDRSFFGRLLPLKAIGKKAARCILSTRKETVW